MKTLYPFLLIILLSGCASFAPTAQKTISKVSVANEKLADNNQAKLSTIGELSYGVGLSTNIVTAHTINQRIQSLSPTPSIAQINEVQQMVNELNKTNTDLLSKKDSQIQQLQSETSYLQLQKETAVKNVEKETLSLAKVDDAQEKQLGEYQAFFGLGGVVLGFWQFIKTAAWVIGSLLFIYFVLRALSSVNPIASAIFTVLSHIGAAFIKGVEIILPNSISLINKLEGDVNTVAQTAAVSPVTINVTSPASISATTPVSSSLSGSAASH